MAKTTVRVQLLGEDGNAFYILGKVARALREAGLTELATEYQKEAKAGDYNHLLRVTMDYVEIE